MLRIDSVVFISVEIFIENDLGAVLMGAALKKGVQDFKCG